MAQNPSITLVTSLRLPLQMKTDLRVDIAVPGAKLAGGTYLVLK